MTEKQKQKYIKEFEENLHLETEKAELLADFLKRTINERLPRTFYQVAQYAQAKNINFNDINNLYVTYLQYKADEIKKPLLHGLLIRPNKKNGKLYVNRIYFIDELQNFYYLIKCKRINIQERKINGKIYDFIIDNEMLLNDTPKMENISALQKAQKETIINRFMILGQADQNGQETSLNEEDIQSILKSLVQIKTTNKKGEEITKTILLYDF